MKKDTFIDLLLLLVFLLAAFISNAQVKINSAGSQVDPNRTIGDVIIPAGTDYEVEFFGEARLMPGFQVEKGAVFKLIPSDY